MFPDSFSLTINWICGLVTIFSDLRECGFRAKPDIKTGRIGTLVSLRCFTDLRNVCPTDCPRSTYHVPSGIVGRRRDRNPYTSAAIENKSPLTTARKAPRVRRSSVRVIFKL
jgi:hypothetical protein